MKKNIIICMILFITKLNTYSEEAHDYEEILIHSFTIGSADDQLGLLTGDSAYGTSATKPMSMNFDDKNNLIICDMINSRVLLFNKDFILKESYYNYKMSTSGVIFNFSEDLLFGVGGSMRHYILNKKNNKSVEVTVPFKVGDSTTTNTVFTEKIIFSYLKDGSICSFILEDKENLTYSKMLNSNETRMLFSHKEEYSLGGYELDSKDRIYLNGKLQNRDYKTMYAYWDEEHKKKNETQPREIPKVPNFEKLSTGGTYNGEDVDGNTYWRFGNTTLIFDKNGWVLDAFAYDKKPIAGLAVNSNGDVFYIALDDIGDKLIFNMYKIERQW